MEIILIERLKSISFDTLLAIFADLAALYSNLSFCHCSTFLIDMRILTLIQKKKKPCAYGKCFSFNNYPTEIEIGVHMNVSVCMSGVLMRQTQIFEQRIFMCNSPIFFFLQHFQVYNGLNNS